MPSPPLSSRTRRQITSEETKTNHPVSHHACGLHCWTGSRWQRPRTHSPGHPRWPGPSSQLAAGLPSVPRSVCNPLWKDAGRRRYAPLFSRSQTESQDDRGEEEGAEEALGEAGHVPSTPGWQEETPGLPVVTGAPAPQGAGVLVWVWSTRGFWHSGSQVCSMRLSCASTGRPRAALLGGWLTTSCGPRQARGTSSAPLGRPPSCPLLLQDSLPCARPCQPSLTEA